MNLKRRQELSLDGIETSLFMIKVCYTRLQKTILQYSSTVNKGGDAVQHLQILIFLDVWSFVDIIDRLRLLISQLPGLKKGTPIVLFQKATEDAETLRDRVQHLDNEISQLEDTGHPIWGSLSWIYSTPGQQNRVNVMVIIPGRVARSKGLPFVNPAGRRIELPVDHISLSASGTTMNISDLYRITVGFGERFQSALVRAKETHNNSDSNEILQIILQE